MTLIHISCRSDGFPITVMSSPQVVLLQLGGSAELLSPAAHQAPRSTYIMSHAKVMWSPQSPLLTANASAELPAVHQACNSACMIHLVSHATVYSQSCKVHNQRCCSSVALLSCIACWCSSSSINLLDSGHVTRHSG